MKAALLKDTARSPEERAKALSHTSLSRRTDHQKLIALEDKYNRLVANTAGCKTFKLPNAVPQTKEELEEMVKTAISMLAYFYELVDVADDSIVPKETRDEWQRSGDWILRCLHNSTAKSHNGHRYPKAEASRRVAYAIAQISPFCAKTLHVNYPQVFPSLDTLQKERELFFQAMCGDDTVGIRATTISTFPQLLDGVWEINIPNAGTMYYKVGPVMMASDSVFIIRLLELLKNKCVGAAFTLTSTGYTFAHEDHPSTAASEMQSLCKNLSQAMQQLVVLLTPLYPGGAQTCGAIIGHNTFTGADFMAWMDALFIETGKARIPIFVVAADHDPKQVAPLRGFF